MKQVFTSPDQSLVGLYNSILESEGISTLLRNYHTANGASGLFYPPSTPSSSSEHPNICVLNDNDYERAIEVINAYSTKE